MPPFQTALSLQFLITITLASLIMASIHLAHGLPPGLSFIVAISSFVTIFFLDFHFYSTYNVFRVRGISMDHLYQQGLPWTVKMEVHSKIVQLIKTLKYSCIILRLLHLSELLFYRLFVSLDIFSGISVWSGARFMVEISFLIIFVF